ncbi:uncharacterized protein LOC123966925 isoform X2 [Micropterus dolomieu]|uniref:uncharacterized protein LOC123966925 isoform X2 n=1 Tax=Micropterus dolomieu TaxID=147949 RepID=UPI001E8DC86F|nr:uncharacterized protein LOC123966925 isoform X2 [Micropterus dolomieu]
MSGRVTGCCVALFLVLTSVSAVQRINSINDLKRINFGQSVPKHSLVLLHWFASVVDIDNNVIWLTFDPNNEDYGSHHYGNFEELLDPLPWGYRYYTVGNLYQDTLIQLPSYVVRPPDPEYVGRNRDRIIIRVREQNTRLRSIDQVYITQHYEPSENQGTPYDPTHTYQITTNLLRQIREFSVGENQQTLTRLRNRFRSHADEFHIRNTWRHLACLGLFLFIVIEEKNSFKQDNDRQENGSRPQNNRLENNNRSENNDRQENGSRPQNNRLENNNRSENNDRQENRHNHCKSRRFIYLTLAFIITLLYTFFAIYFR